MLELENDSNETLQEDFMMILFDEHVVEFPTLKEHLVHTQTKKNKRRVVSIPLNKTCLTCKFLRMGLFFPEEESSEKTNLLMENLGKIDSTAILKELRYPSKTSTTFLSSIVEEFSWEMTSEKERLHGMHLHANNNQPESSFGDLTPKKHDHGAISLPNPSGVSTIRKNVKFHHDNSSHP